MKKSIGVFIGILLLFSCQDGSRQVQNIEAFAKIYGYARWFHPSDEAQEIDWNKFAILGIQKVENIQSDTELRDTLLSLFSPIVQGIRIFEANKTEEFDSLALTPSHLNGNKVVAWQHSGVYLGNGSNIYKSIRTNINQDAASSFYQLIPIDRSLMGKTMKISGYFKDDCADTAANATFFICPLKSDEFPQSSKLLSAKNSVKITAEKWKKYELTQTISSNSKYACICFGCTLKNKVNLSADNFQISINGKNIKVMEDTLKWTSSELLHKIESSDKDPYSGKYCLRAKYRGMQSDQYPRFGEYIEESIGCHLTCIIPLALYESNGHTYPSTDRNLLDGLKANISNVSCVHDHYSDLASIIIVWNVFQHFHPYLDVIKTNWEKALPQTLAEIYKNQDKNNFVDILSKMVAKAEDGHGYVSGKNMFHLPIRTEFIENQIIITASNDTDFNKGDIIKKVDGVPAKRVLLNLEKTVSGSPQLKRYRALNIFGSKFSKEYTTITVERDGKIVKIDTRTKNASKSLFFNEITDFKYKDKDILEIEPGIIYLNLANFSDARFDSCIERLANAKCVIYDFRMGGRGISELIPHLIKTPVNSTWWNIPQTIYPNHRDVTYYKTNWSIEPKSPLFKSESIILTAPCVVSGGETYMDIIDNYGLAVTVGETTAGCNGNVNIIKLPCDYEVMWTGMKVMKHDGSQLYLTGFQPDYPVSKTIEGVLSGTDEELEKALEIARLKSPYTQSEKHKSSNK